MKREAIAKRKQERLEREEEKQRIAAEKHAALVEKRNLEAQLKKAAAAERRKLETEKRLQKEQERKEAQKKPRSNYRIISEVSLNTKKSPSHQSVKKVEEKEVSSYETSSDDKVEVEEKVRQVGVQDTKKESPKPKRKQ